jgi:hypothetical protein
MATLDDLLTKLDDRRRASGTHGLADAARADDVTE